MRNHLFNESVPDNSRNAVQLLIEGYTCTFVQKKSLMKLGFFFLQKLKLSVVKAIHTHLINACRHHNTGII